MTLLPESLYSISCESAIKIFNEVESQRLFLSEFNDLLSPLCGLYAFVLLPEGVNMIINTTSEIDWESYLRQNNLLIKDYDVFQEAGGMLLMGTLVQNKISAFIKKHIPTGKYTISSLETANLGPQLAAVHLLPVQKKLCANPVDWLFSSYNAFLSDKPTRIPRQQILNLIGGSEAFRTLHQ